MFCNQCGKENKDGAKFCIHCGKELPVIEKKVNVVNNVSACSNTKTASDGKKTMILSATIIILILIAIVNIASVSFGVKNVETKNHEMVANMNREIIETNSCIYYTTGNGLYRADKATRTATRVSKQDFDIITASSNTVYLLGDSGFCYKISDKDKKPEKYFELGSYGSNTYFDGKYNYYVDGDGVLTKSLNSDEFYDYSMEINEGIDDEDDEVVTDVKYYKGYAYMIITDSDYSYDENRLARMSLKTGKIEEIYDDEAVAKYGITDDKIVAKLVDGGFVILSLKGKVVEEYYEFSDNSYHDFFCLDGYVYYIEDGLNRFNIANGDNDELDSDVYYYAGLPSGLAYTDDNKLLLFDRECDEIATFKP